MNGDRLIEVHGPSALSGGWRRFFDLLVLMATTDFKKFGGSDRSRAGSFHLTKTLDCADGSGSFTIVVNAATVFGSPTDQGGWAVLSGTDDYATLRGGGRLVGTYVPDGVIDTYSGSLRK